jgi:flagellar hook-associated protein 1 FlgK
LINIRVEENPGGTVSVYTGGEFLVFEGITHTVEVTHETDRGMTIANIHMATTGALLDPASGQLRGLLDSRDKVLGGFLDQLDSFAATLAFEFNKIYSRGQGLSGFTQLTSGFAVDDKQQPLNAAGLKFTPQNGSFQVLVHNKTTDLTATTDVLVHLDGQGHQTTLADLASAIDAIPGISAQMTVGGGLTITADSSEHEFAFANDTSGVLAALGLNTFFTGSTARDLGVNTAVQQDPAKFAASRDGIGHDTEIAKELANFIDRPIASQNSASLGVLYNRMTGETAQASSIAKAVADGAQTFETTLRGQKLSISGVNLDEEAVKMIGYQRSYQAAAKYIATLTGLFDLLVQL